MSLELITIKELLRDPEYREYFKKVPKLPDHLDPTKPHWKLYYRRPGEAAWRTARFNTYREAVARFKELYKDIEDAAINCPGLDFMPPVKTYRIKGKFKIVQGGHKKPVYTTRVWIPRLESEMAQHHWCSHCRRPTIFKFAVKRFKTAGFDDLVAAPALRCIICGASDRIVNIHRPTNAQKWDPNRPKVHV